MRDDTALVVDDERQIRRLVASALREEPPRALEAAAGRCAIDLATAERPSL